MVVSVLAPIPADAHVLRRMLEGSDYRTKPCKHLEDLAADIAENTTAAVLTSEALDMQGLRVLREALAAQPEWSEYPIVLLTAGGTASDPVSALVDDLFQNEQCSIAVLERPVRPLTFLSTVRLAVQSRARQLRVRDELARRQEAERSLENLDRRKDEVLAALGHELRNPLGAIRSALHVLQLTEDRENRREAERILERQIGHLDHLVDDVLDVSRISRGELSLRKEEFVLQQIARESVESVSAALEASGHALATEIPEEEIFVHGDALRISQVYVNLLLNAAKYTPRGGHIRLSIRVVDEVAISEVEDDGRGLEPHELQPIFEMFHRIGKSGEDEEEGLGIGLALARSFVERHGGTIRALSDGPGRGSLFRFTLPAVRGGSGRRESTEPTTSAGKLAPRRVLIVEDNRDAARSLEALLQIKGHHVCVRHDGPAGVEAAARFAPHLVLLDLGLPGISGHEVARRIRQHPGGSDVFLVALTGWGQDEDRRRSDDAGFDAHLTKPLGMEDLDRLLGAC